MITALNNRDFNSFCLALVSVIVCGLSVLGLIVGIGLIVQDDIAGAGLAMVSVGLFVSGVYGSVKAFRIHEEIVAEHRKTLTTSDS